MFQLDGPQVTPLVAAARLAGRPGRFLLDSASNHDGCGRWSFVGAEPEEVIHTVEFAELAEIGELRRGDSDPVPVFVGYLGYDFGRSLIRKPGAARRDVDLPDAWFGRYGAVWRFDRTTGQGCVVGVDDRAARRLRAWLDIKEEPTAVPRFGPLYSDETRAWYDDAVARILEYIRAGDVYQVNLARRLSAKIVQVGDALALYEALSHRFPAPFGALLECGEAQIISNSPELFLRAGCGAAETRPIKGTRGRVLTDELGDTRLASELLEDPKERAEHLMIVDLERNDLGRIARTGSVRVDGFARVVSLPTVHHLVSTVRCETDADIGELLAATFPGGSITGAPKIRAMEIIDELEPVRRGVYTGAIGYVGAHGACDFSVAIRTAILCRDALHLHVGGGIVADSTAAREWAETEEKAAAWRGVLS